MRSNKGKQGTALQINVRRKKRITSTRNQARKSNGTEFILHFNSTENAEMKQPSQLIVLHVILTQLWIQI